MAAQDYYQGNSGNLPPAPSAAPTARPTNPAPLQVPGNPPYPLYDGPPPPYSPGEGRANSQPPPHRRTDSLGETLSEKPQRQASPRIPQYEQGPRPEHLRVEHNPPHPPRPSPADYESQFRPAVRQQHSYAYPDEKRHYQGAPPVQPHTNHVGFGGAQYYPPRERSRSRSRSRDRKKHHQRKKSSGINTFLGAGGGALIGDAIFPGLGTLGGAILGGFGGHEYGKSKKDTRHRERRYSDEYEYRPSRRN